MNEIRRFIGGLTKNRTIAKTSSICSRNCMSFVYIYQNTLTVLSHNMSHPDKYTTQHQKVNLILGKGTYAMSNGTLSIKVVKGLAKSMQTET